MCMLKGMAAGFVFVSVVRYVEGHGGLLHVVNNMLKGMAAGFVL